VNVIPGYSSEEWGKGKTNRNTPKAVKKKAKEKSRE